MHGSMANCKLLRQSDVIQLEINKMLKYRLVCQKGFTLIEMAVVLVIIGIILTTVIKGGEILKSSRTKGLIQTQNDLQQATMLYREKYGNFGFYSSVTMSKLKQADMVTSNPTDPFDTMVDRNFGCNITFSKYPFYYSATNRTNIQAVKYSKLTYDAAIAMEIALDGVSGNNAKSGSVQGSTVDECATDIATGVTTCADNDYTSASATYSDLSSKKYTVYVALYPVAP